MNNYSQLNLVELKEELRRVSLNPSPIDANLVESQTKLILDEIERKTKMKYSLSINNKNNIKVSIK